MPLMIFAKRPKRLESNSTGEGTDRVNQKGCRWNGQRVDISFLISFFYNICHFFPIKKITHTRQRKFRKREITHVLSNPEEN